MSKKSSKLNKFGNIVGNIILLCSVILLIFSSYTAYKYKNDPENAYLFNYKPVVILTGSMEPTLKEKGMCIVKKTSYSEIQPDDIVMFVIENKTITHRVVEITADGIQTKGDNNNVNDAFLLQEENIKAKVVTIMNWTAPIILKLETNAGRISLLIYLSFIIFVVVMAKIIIKKIIKTPENKKIEVPDMEDKE